MITTYVIRDDALSKCTVNDQHFSTDKLIWIDLIDPTPEEEYLLEKNLKINIPNREEISEIEVSNCLYSQDEAYYLRMNILSPSGHSDDVINESVTFILKDDILITVRFMELHIFKNLSTKMSKLSLDHISSNKIFINLLHANIYYAADILEQIGRGLDQCTRFIFHRDALTPQSQKPNFQVLLENLGINEDMMGRVRESLLSFHRLANYVRSNDAKLSSIQAHMNVLIKDATALNDHVFFLSGKLNFILDAILGMINIEQNNTIKIFSVAAVIFLPPTLIASIYGMNFKNIPELSWKAGYPMAIGLMILSVLIPFKYFKQKKWL